MKLNGDEIHTKTGYVGTLIMDKSPGQQRVSCDASKHVGREVVQGKSEIKAFVIRKTASCIAGEILSLTKTTHKEGTGLSVEAYIRRGNIIYGQCCHALPELQSKICWYHPYAV